MSAPLVTDRVETDAREEALRICVMTDCAHGIGGMQRHTHDLVQGLIRVGHEVDVICPADPTLDPDAYGARWHLVDTPGRSDKRWETKFRAAFTAADRSRPFDLVHSESTAAQGLLNRPALDTPIVFKYHGCYISLTSAHARRVFQRPGSILGETKGWVDMTVWYVREGGPWRFRAFVSIAPSYEQLEHTARSVRVPRHLMHVVPNGIDADAFRPRDSRELRRTLGLPDGRLLVTAGRLNGEKGFDLAIRALSRIAEDHPDARLLIVGDGDERESLERLAATLGMTDRVLFVGGHPPERVAEYLAASDVFLFPTRRHEAGPIVLLEGMACGLPTIATRIGGNIEVVEPPDGPVAGLLTRMGDVKDLEAAIRRILTDDAHARTLGERARARILDEYTLDKMIERTVAVYGLAIARAKTAA